MHSNLPDNTKFVKTMLCPHCGHTLDAASAMDGSDLTPNPGDMSVCISCGEFLEFDKEMTLVTAHNGILDEFPPQQRLELEAYQNYIKLRGPIETDSPPTLQ